MALHYQQACYIPLLHTDKEISFPNSQGVLSNNDFHYQGLIGACAGAHELGSNNN
jgi:hypothetical protein